MDGFLASYWSDKFDDTAKLLDDVESQDPENTNAIVGEGGIPDELQDENVESRNGGYAKLESNNDGDPKLESNEEEEEEKDSGNEQDEDKPLEEALIASEQKRVLQEGGSGNVGGV